MLIEQDNEKENLYKIIDFLMEEIKNLRRENARLVELLEEKERPFDF